MGPPKALALKGTFPIVCHFGILLKYFSGVPIKVLLSLSNLGVKVTPMSSKICAGSGRCGHMPLWSQTLA
jgi:hypothetical protein